MPAKTPVTLDVRNKEEEITEIRFDTSDDRIFLDKDGIFIGRHDSHRTFVSYTDMNDFVAGCFKARELMKKRLNK